MNRRSVYVSLFAAAGLVVIASVAIAQQAKDVVKEGIKSAAGEIPELKLPPGWSESDMQACMMAGMPGEQHAHLAKDAGVWYGKNTMWMAPGAEAVQSECKATMTTMMDGRFLKCEVEGEMPGMGPFNGFGLYGYDNVSQKFVGTWIDNCGTGIMTGTGELSADGKVMTWTYTYNCPITKKPMTMREVDTTTGPSTKTMEMFGKDPKSGQEYKMMVIEYVRKS